MRLRASGRLASHMSLSYNYPPQMAYPSAPPVYRNFPAPPRLHWGIVFALSFVTFGLFGMIWLVVQASWVKKATQNAKPFWYCLAYLLVIPAAMVVAFVGGMVAQITIGPHAVSEVIGSITVLMQIGSFVLYIFAAFTLKGGLEMQPIDIPLGGIMTFFFSATYFQYHLFDYSVEGKVGEQLSGFEEVGTTLHEATTQ